MATMGRSEKANVEQRGQEKRDFVQEREIRRFKPSDDPREGLKRTVAVIVFSTLEGRLKGAPADSAALLCQRFNFSFATSI